MPARVRRRPVLDFTLGPFQSVLDAVEFDGTDPEVALAQPRHWHKCHAAHREWTVQAVHNYLRVRAELDAERIAARTPPMHPVAEEWVVLNTMREPDHRGVWRYERTAWGRRYATPDGAERELWLLSFNTVRTNRSAAEIAAAASVAAMGVPAAARFGEPYRAVRPEPVMPAWVRVLGFGCGDGSVEVLADSDADQARRAFDRDAKSVLTDVVDARTRTPGSTCVSCEGLATCHELPSRPGILGVAAPERTAERIRRSVSVSDLRAHGECPARHHLTRVLHLKDTKPEHPAIRRGRAVDAWLNQCHAATPREACTVLDLPDLLPGLTSEETPAALRMLEHHRAHCPLHRLGKSERVRVQPRVTVHDPVVDVVVIADPDLLYTDQGGWVWRETKTASSRPWEGRDFLETYPQLALAVLLLECGVLGGDLRRSRIELEVLYEHTSTLQEVDPADPRTVADARQVVAAMAVPWAVDETYEAKPGRWCGGCEAQRWCAPGRESLASAEAVRK
ncbi:PD-(D/E)XK nuclease family protein [Yinghuangia sp. YIM S09857]|uniref:PD-(D/E)XK nuclease family protein n=1 Tax=Yinghuangia sp. YIM S09857 TaxID=3436929 RepID=UPI003F53ADB4